MIKTSIYYLYAKCFARKSFSRLNQLLYNLSLRGLGICNYQNSKISGERNFLQHCLSKLPSPVIFDVGANRGRYCSDCIDANKHSQIYAFEPHPKTFEILVSNVSGKNVIPINKALSDSICKSRLYDYEQNEGSTHATLCRDVIENVHGSRSTFYVVSTTTLDSFVQEKGIRKIDLLKIDVEGNDIKVLRGAKKSIEQGIINIIQFEFTQINPTSRVFMKDYFDLLEANYSLYRLLPSGLLPMGKYAPIKHEIYGYQNIAAVRKPTNV